MSPTPTTQMPSPMKTRPTTKRAMGGLRYCFFSSVSFFGISSFLVSGGRGSDSGRSPPKNLAALALTTSLEILPSPPHSLHLVEPPHSGHFWVPLQLGQLGDWP